jgi:ribosomal protein S6
MMKKYDGLFIFASVAKDEALEGQIEKACAEITRLNGSVLSTEPLGKKTFARPMRKRENGTFVKIRFALDPAQVAALKARYRLLEDFFRVQVLTVDERREAIIVKQTEQEKAREAAREAARAAALAAAEAEKERLMQMQEQDAAEAAEAAHAQEGEAQA